MPKGDTQSTLLKPSLMARNGVVPGHALHLSQSVGASLTYGDPYDRTTIRRPVKSPHPPRISTRTFDPYVRPRTCGVTMLRPCWLSGSRALKRSIPEPSRGTQVIRTEPKTEERVAVPAFGDDYKPPFRRRAGGGTNQREAQEAQAGSGDGVAHAIGGNGGIERTPSAGPRPDQRAPRTQGGATYADQSRGATQGRFLVTRLDKRNVRSVLKRRCVEAAGARGWVAATQEEASFGR
jgi:hypothetical protein